MAHYQLIRNFNIFQHSENKKLKIKRIFFFQISSKGSLLHRVYERVDSFENNSINIINIIESGKFAFLGSDVYGTGTASHRFKMVKKRQHFS